MSDSQITPEENIDTTDDRVSDAMAQLEAASFSIGEYHVLAQTILRLLMTSHEDMITDETQAEDACFLTFMATTYASAEKLLSIGDEDDEEGEDDTE
jgi:hypothetical protein